MASLNRKHKRMSHRGEFGISLKKAWWGHGAAPALMNLELNTPDNQVEENMK